MNGRIVISIPMELDSRQEIATALEHQYGTDYVFMGRVFQSTIADSSCEIDICHLPIDINKSEVGELDCHSRKLSFKHNFEFVERDKLDPATLQRLDRSQQVIYLTSTETGYQACVQIAQLAQVLLQIGGIAIQVESAGISHCGDKWLDNYDSTDVFDIYSLFVGLIEGEAYYYSCGMHHFGKADVAIALDTDIGLAIYVMNVFNYYRLTESPILQDGHTFRPDIECPQYILKWIADSEHTANSDRYNPHGRWLLTVNSQQLTVNN